MDWTSAIDLEAITVHMLSRNAFAFKRSRTVRAKRSNRLKEFFLPEPLDANRTDSVTSRGLAYVRSAVLNWQYFFSLLVSNHFSLRICRFVALPPMPHLCASLVPHGTGAFVTGQSALAAVTDLGVASTNGDMTC